MSQNRNNRNYRQAAYDINKKVDSRKSRNEYVYENTVRKLKPVREQWEKAPAKKPQPEVRKNRDRAHHMNAPYVLFLAAALCAAAFVLVHYIQIQADLTIMNKTIASRQSELNNLKMSNDEEYNRIVNSIDLEEVKRVAMGELGMIYAQDEQIIIYEDKSSDYMRQVTNGGQNGK